MEKEPVFYLNFEHPVSQLSAFSLCIDVFVISLKNGKIVRFKPQDIVHFEEWLRKYSIRDIRVDTGIPVDYTTARLYKSVKRFSIFNLNTRAKRK